MQKNQFVTVVAGVAIVVALVLGYMLYQEQQNKVQIELPGVKIEAQ